jgi:hypothetical protein
MGVRREKRTEKRELRRGCRVAGLSEILCVGPYSSEEDAWPHTQNFGQTPSELLRLGLESGVLAAASAEALLARSDRARLLLLGLLKRRRKFNP